MCTDVCVCADVQKSRSKQSMMYVPAALTVKKVFSQLKDIAQMTGSKVCCSNVQEARYVAAMHRIRYVAAMYRIRYECLRTTQAW